MENTTITDTQIETLRANAVAQIVRNDAECSARRWEGAVESAERVGDSAQAQRWEEQGKRCAEHYDSAIEAIGAGDMAEAEAELELANALESDAGDNCDAHHALQALRCVEVASLPDDAVIVETMPEQHRESHRAAGNWGSYPHNGAEVESGSEPDSSRGDHMRATARDE